MIDRAARDQLSRGLRRLVAGGITNDRFERSTLANVVDAAILAITDMSWLLYSDMKEHRLVGRHSLAPIWKRKVLRWVLFLDGDFEYRWPVISLPGLPPMQRARPVVTRWLSGPNAISYESATEFLAAGDYNAWPFISRSEYKHALRHPRRLVGKPRSSRTEQFGI